LGQRLLSHLFLEKESFVSGHRFSDAIDCGKTVGFSR
jgi:hypothetical protein